MEDRESILTTAWLHNNRIRILLSSNKESIKKYEKMNELEALNEVLKELNILKNLIEKAKTVK